MSDAVNLFQNPPQPIQGQAGDSGDDAVNLFKSSPVSHAGFRAPGAEPQNLAERAEDTYGLKNYERRSTFLPLAQTHEGELEFALPGIIAGPIQSSTLPAHALEGGQYTAEDTLGFTMDLAAPGAARTSAGVSPSRFGGNNAPLVGPVAKPDTKTPGGLAQQRVLEAMELDQRTPAQVAARLKRLGPLAALADAGGENLRGLSRATAGVPGPGKERARSVFNQRGFGEGSRLQEAFQQGTNAQEYFAASDELMGNLRGRAQPMYKRAYEAGPNLQSDKLDELLSRDVSRQALKEAQELAAIDGETVSIPPEGISTETLDDMKRGFDSLLEKPEYRGQFGGLNKKGHRIKDLKNEILREADRLNPAYREARMAYKGDAEMIDALERGTKFKQMSAEEVRRTLADMTEAEKQAFRNGAAKGVLLDINRTGDNRSIAQKLGGSPEIRAKMKALFKDPQEFRDFTRLLIQEGRFQNTRNMVLGGSQTAPRIAEQQAAQQGQGLAGGAANVALNVGGDVLAGAPGATAAARGAAGFASRGLEALGRGRKQRKAAADAKSAAELERDTAGILSRILFNRNQGLNQQALRELTNPTRRAPAVDAVVAKAGADNPVSPFVLGAGLSRLSEEPAQGVESLPYVQNEVWRRVNEYLREQERLRIQKLLDGA